MFDTLFAKKDTDNNTFNFPKTVEYCDRGVLEDIFSYLFYKKVFKCPKCGIRLRWKVKNCHNCNAKFEYI